MCCTTVILPLRDLRWRTPRKLQRCPSWRSTSSNRSKRNRSHLFSLLFSMQRHRIPKMARWGQNWRPEGNFIQFPRTNYPERKWDGKNTTKHATRLRFANLYKVSGSFLQVHGKYHVFYNINTCPFCYIFLCGISIKKSTLPIWHR